MANNFSQWIIPDSEISSIRQYLIFRGLSSTSKTFENEIKQDRDKHLMVDKIIEQIQAYISSHDIVSLRDYWTFLEQRVLLHADLSLSAYTNRLWTGLLRVYLCHTSQAARQDKLIEFFEKMAPYLLNSSHADWRDWYVLPYIKNAEEKVQYSLYFNRQWQDTLFLSLFNFLNTVINNLPQPTILNYTESEQIIEKLRTENAKLKNQIEDLLINQTTPTILNETDSNLDSAKIDLYSDSTDSILPSLETRLLPDATENSDDFINISQSTMTRQSSNQSLVSKIRNIGSSSPIILQKPVAKIIPKKNSQTDTATVSVDIQSVHK